MDHGSSLLLGLAGLGVEDVERDRDGARVVHVITVDEQAAACPSCGVFSRSVKGNVTTAPKDLPYGEEPLAIRWHKRRWRCAERRCDRLSFTESIGEVPAGRRTTGRLLRSCVDAVVENRCVDEVARAHGVSWPTVQRAVDDHARANLGEPGPTPVLGIDETRFGAPRWAQDPLTEKWRLTDPWETGFVDLATGQGVLGQVTGRTSAAVIAWLLARDQAWRDAVLFVAIDPAAPYRAAVRTALPHAVIVVDHFHLVRLGNQVVTAVRQRVTQHNLGRRGRKSDPVWTNRRLLLRARERLSTRAFARMWNGCIDTDPTGELLAAWIGKELLRELLATARRGGHRHEISTALYRFYHWCAAAEIPELTTLAETVEAWWPEILAFLHTKITNAGTEGTNRLTKQVKRGACGFRNKQHYRDRVRLHSARPTRRTSASTRHLPG